MLVFQGGGYATALVMVVAGTDVVLEVIGFVHFILKKYNRSCVIFCFRNCFCESGVINTKMVFEKFGCVWRERRKMGGFAINEENEGKIVISHGL